MEYRPPKQAISSKVYDLDLNGFTESQLRYEIITRDSISLYCDMMQQDGDLLSRKLSSQPATLKAVNSLLDCLQVRLEASKTLLLLLNHAVFNSQGDQEAALNDSAKGFLREFKLLIKVIKEGHVKMSVEESKLQMLRSQLDLFDKVWCAFLNSFVLWKFKDTRLLGEDKVRAACQLEISMIQKCKITPEGDRHCAHS
ncbi:hypothetical protein Bca52824_082848 [Brassica carinata]|uniref:Uncharacterized protein n=1 Tax=Brassica carinata TaxID=52824 RepID=A0A8X7PKK9_BRACI|nr:hypothetical protein Bca52824_082848 [Brassica carinata]